MITRETGNGSVPSTAEDIALRLQQLIVGWRGIDRGERLSALHDACVAAVGPGGRSLLPAAVLLVPDLDETSLATALRRASGVARSASPRFRALPSGRFDAALVPVGLAGEPPDRWVFAVDANLPTPEHVALYGHAVGHLLLNREMRQMRRIPLLDPRDRRAHVDTLAELREFEGTRQALNRRVLESYPLLTSLLRVRDESAVATIPDDLRQLLGAAGWRGSRVKAPYVFTAGRVFLAGDTAHHGPRLRVDALLRAEPSVPIAVVQTLRPGETGDDAERRLVEYARNRLAVPFAYLVDATGTIVELDWSGSACRRDTRAALPTRDELWTRWLGALGLADVRAAQVLRYPYQGGGQSLRYYQEAAINRAVLAVLQARRGARAPRILLNLATGTGKTKIAFQTAWKLKQAREVRNLLFLTDRDYLLGQAMDNEFAPFGDARERVQGEARTARDVLFATYQAIADAEGRRGLYRGYPRDFFDLIIVDECHRGSAQDDSNWRGILDYFDRAVQIGLTATPRREDNAPTYAYFGDPVHTYSLRAGINDGFLAPYRVRRILMDAVEDGEELTQTPVETGVGGERTEVTERSETSQTLRARTGVVATHLAAFLMRTDPLAKTIVFCVDQAHADAIRVALERALPDYVARYPGYAERIVADEGAEGRRALGRFSTPDERTPVIVTTSKLLSTGVDVPTCKNVVLARRIESIVEFKQIIGRGTRLYEPVKTWFTILDYAGATRLFFDPDFDGDPEVVEVEPLLPEGTPEVAPGEVAPSPTAEIAPEEGTVEESDRTAATPSGIPTISAEPLMLADRPSAEDGGPAPGPAAVADQRGDYAGVSPEATETALVEGATHSDSAAPTNPDDAGAPVVAKPARRTDASNGGQSRGATFPDTETVARSTVAVAWQTPTGKMVKVVGEIVYELAPDGTTLRQVSYRDFTKEALEGLATSPADLRARWVQPQQRGEIQDRLMQQGVDLALLADAVGAPSDVDPLDLLQNVAFGTPPRTRAERVAALGQASLDFFAPFDPSARDVLDAILAKYAAGEADVVADTELLRVPPLSDLGTPVEIMQRFGGGAPFRAALGELQKRLYQTEPSPTTSPT